jgi:hypothetical protein
MFANHFGSVYSSSCDNVEQEYQDRYNISMTLGSNASHSRETSKFEAQ